MRLFNVQILPLFIVGGLILVAGCHLTGRDRLESSLRQHEAGIRALERQLATARKQLRDQEDELLALKQTKHESSIHMAASSKTLETAVAWGSIRKLRIHSLASGVLKSADDKLVVSVVVQPLDGDGEVVKVAGELSVRLQLPGETSLLAETAATSLESRSLWRSGLVTRGFQVEIPLEQDAGATPQPHGEILVTATLNLGGDRRFTTSKLVRVPR
ncbi:MAG: hypothetical protein ABGZ35_05020 [Planctomycetaceae bacterium]|jgi:hypothetical protein